VPAWIIMRIVIFKAERADRRHLRDVLRGALSGDLCGAALANRSGVRAAMAIKANYRTLPPRTEMRPANHVH
jgi:hypothetical protein